MAITIEIQNIAEEALYHTSLIICRSSKVSQDNGQSSSTKRWSILQHPEPSTSVAPDNVGATPEMITSRIIQWRGTIPMARSWGRLAVAQAAERSGWGTLADDMGLGKIAIALLVLVCRSQSEQMSDSQTYRPTLIVVPASVIEVWKNQIRWLFPVSDPCVLNEFTMRATTRSIQVVSAT